MKVLFGFFIALISVFTAFYLTHKYLRVNNTPPTRIDTNLSQISVTPFSLLAAPSKSYRGKLTIISDDVLWQDRVATESSVVKENITIQQGEKIETNKNGNAQIVFENILKIEMYPSSSLNIIQTLPGHMVISIDYGKLSLNTTNNSVTAVRVYHLLIELNGRADIDIEDQPPIVKLKVLSGSATLAYNDLDFNTQTLKVEGGEIIEFDDSTRKVVPK